MTENRRDGSGRRLGPKPEWLARMNYDEKQMRQVVEPRRPKRRTSAVREFGGEAGQHGGAVEGEDVRAADGPVGGDRDHQQGPSLGAAEQERAHCRGV